MKRICNLLFFMAVGCTMVLAQSEQRIMVQEYQQTQAKTPMSQVSVTVTGAAGVITEADGTATLRFRQLRVGDPVKVRRVVKEGYEIFNQQALDAWTVAPQQTFALVLCRSEHLRQLKERYMRVASQSYEQQYKRDLNRLEQLKKQQKMVQADYEAQAQQLENEYLDRLDQLDNYVDHFARIDLSELSSAQRELVTMVEEGRIDEAIARYEAADYLGQYNEQKRQLDEARSARQELTRIEADKRQARQQIQDAIERQVMTYQLAGGSENFAKIRRLLQGVADADTTNLSAVRRYALYASSQTLFDDAERYLAIYMRGMEDDPRIQAEMHLNYAEILAARLQFGPSEQHTRQAIAIAQQWQQAHPSPSADALWCQAHITLLNMLVYIGREAEAATFAPALLAKVEALSQDDAEAWLQARADILVAMSQIALAEGDIPRGESYALQAAEALKPYVKVEDVALFYAYLKANQQLIGIYYYTEQWDKQLPCQLEDLRLGEEQYRRNPEVQLIYMENSYNNMCELCVHLGRLDEARNYLQKAMALMTQMIERYGDTVIDDHFALLDTAVAYCQASGQQDEARSHAREALELYARMAPETREQRAEIAQRLEQVITPN